MRPFKCCFSDIEVDLDDPNTYDYLPDDWERLDEMMFQHIGYAICYMDYWYPDIFKSSADDGGQRERVQKLIKDFTDNRKDNYGNSVWFKEKIFLFQDETENMC